MVNYEKIFEPYYEGGWEAYPLETTLVTAGALNAYDAAIMHIEDYLDTEVDPNDNLAETYSDEETYEAGDYRIYNGVLYKCLEDIDEAEEFDPAKWESCLVTDEMGSGGGTTVIPNPVGEPTDDLETIQIGNTIYDIPGGGGGNANIWTGTQAEYEAQASQIADDTVVLITDDEEHTQAFDIYSTDEQVIGTWLDGKPLYRCVLNSLNVSVPSLNTWSGVFADSLNIEDVIDCKMYDVTNADNPIYLSIEQIQVVDGGIRFERTTATVANRTVTRAIIEYTKTTD